MINTVKNKLVTCLKLFDSPQQKKKLSSTITAIEQAVKPIQDDEKLTAVLLQLLREVPELMQDPKSKQLKEFLLTLKYEPMQPRYRRGR